MSALRAPAAPAPGVGALGPRRWRPRQAGGFPPPGHGHLTAVMPPQPGHPLSRGSGGEHGAPRVTRSPKGQSRRGDGLNPLTQTIARLEARWPVRCPCRLKDTPRGPSHGDFHGPSLPLVPARPREAPSPPPGRAGPGPPPWAKRSLLLKVSEPWSLRPLPRLTPHRLGSPTTFSSLLTKATPVTGRPAGAGTHPGAQVE